jgi:transcriptional regulator with GAF, ATPase, and Fis domain
MQTNNSNNIKLNSNDLKKILTNASPSDIMYLLKTFEDIGKPNDSIPLIDDVIAVASDANKKALLMLLKSRLLLLQNKIEEAEKEARSVADASGGTEDFLRAYAYYLIASALILNGRYAEADGKIKRGYSLAGKGSDFVRAHILNVMGRLQAFHGRNLPALTYFEQFLELARVIQDDRLLATALNNIGVIHSYLGNSEKAINYYKQVEEISLNMKNMLQFAYAARNIGEQYYTIGDYQSALQESGRALVALREIDDKPTIVACLGDLALAQIEMGNLESASEYAAEAMKTAEEISLKNKLPFVYELLGSIFLKQNNPLAEFYFKKSVDGYKALSKEGNISGAEYALLGYGKFLVDKKEPAGVEMLCDAAVSFKKPFLTFQSKKAFAEITSLLQENHRAALLYLVEKINSLKSEKGRYEKFVEISKTLASLTETRSIEEAMIDWALEVSGAERGFIARMANGAWSFPVTRNFLTKISDAEFGDAIIKLAEDYASRGAVLIEPNLAARNLPVNLPERFYSSIGSVFVIPFASGAENKGVIYLDSSIAISDSPLWMGEILSTMANHAAVALEKARLYDEVEELNRKLEFKIKKQDDELKATREELIYRQKDLEKKHSYKNIIGSSMKMQDLFLLLDKVVETHLPVLIHGESGTGKELVARAIHYNGLRKKKRFVAVNCPAMPETLLESELFGHVRGAFTGAESGKSGLFEAASGGTIFLDEIAEMSQSMQQKLLRVLQDGEIRRIGSNQTAKIDVRIISASNKNLAELVNRGLFREDLFYRLNVVVIGVPSLRERKEDIPSLFEHFWKQAVGGEPQFAENKRSEFYKILMSYDWPGNIRQLENETRRIAFLGGGVASPQFISNEIVKTVSGSESARDTLFNADDLTYSHNEKNLILTAIHKANGNISRAAKLLGIPRTSLYGKIKRLKLVRNKSEFDWMESDA